MCCFPSNQQRNRRTAVAVLFLVLLASKSFLNAKFFLSINNYTGNYWILLSVFSLLFFSAKMRYLSSSLTLLPFSRTCFQVSLKKSNFSSKFDSTHLAQFLQMFSFVKGLLTSVCYLIYILFVILPPNIKKTPNDLHVASRLSAH